MDRPARLIEGALAGPIEDEMHDIALHHADVGEADVGIRIEQNPKRTRGTVVFGGTVLLGVVESPKLIAVDERGRAGCGACEIGPHVLQENLPDDDIDHGYSRDRGSPGDQAAGDRSQQGPGFVISATPQAG